MNDSRLYLNWRTHSDLPGLWPSTKQNQLCLFTKHSFFTPFYFIYSPLFYFQLVFSSYLPSSSSFSTSSLWIIHWVIHNLGEAARDLHSSLCHWVLFGGIFNYCLIYQIDWELGAWTPHAAVPDMSNYDKVGRQICTYSRRLHMAALGTTCSPLATLILHFLLTEILSAKLCSPH